MSKKEPKVAIVHDWLVGGRHPDARPGAFLAGQPTTAEVLASTGYDEDLVKRITRLVDVAEYKRRQNPPGPRVTPKAFGKDRRLPITNRYQG